mmetsp:Transcript_19101/g.21615  ORF Transcript_19101/g.21615 Transcript_19101/m.21615 type:complete len:727 (-) Transcript_19101:169-2349(-)
MSATTGSCANTDYDGSDTDDELVEMKKELQETRKKCEDLTLALKTNEFDFNKRIRESEDQLKSEKEKTEQLRGCLDDNTSYNIIKDLEDKLEESENNLLTVREVERQLKKELRNVAQNFSTERQKRHEIEEQLAELRNDDGLEDDVTFLQRFPKYAKIFNEMRVKMETLQDDLDETNKKLERTSLELRSEKEDNAKEDEELARYQTESSEMKEILYELKRELDEKVQESYRLRNQLNTEKISRNEILEEMSQTEEKMRVMDRANKILEDKLLFESRESEKRIRHMTEEFEQEKLAIYKKQEIGKQHKIDEEQINLAIDRRLQEVNADHKLQLLKKEEDTNIVERERDELTRKISSLESQIQEDKDAIQRQKDKIVLQQSDIQRWEDSFNKLKISTDQKIRDSVIELKNQKINLENRVAELTAELDSKASITPNRSGNQVSTNVVALNRVGSSDDSDDDGYDGGFEGDGDVEGGLNELGGLEAEMMGLDEVDEGNFTLKMNHRRFTATSSTEPSPVRGRKSVVSKREQIEHLKIEKAALKDQVEKLEIEFKTTLSNSETMQKQNEKSQGELKNLQISSQGEIRELKSKVTNLEKELEKAQQEVAALREEHDEEVKNLELMAREALSSAQRNRRESITRMRGSSNADSPVKEGRDVEVEMLKTEMKMLETQISNIKNQFDSEQEILKQELKRAELIAIEAKLSYAEVATEKDIWLHKYKKLNKNKRKK